MMTITDIADAGKPTGEGNSFLYLATLGRPYEHDEERHVRVWASTQAEAYDILKRWAAFHGQTVYGQLISSEVR